MCRNFERFYCAHGIAYPVQTFLRIASAGIEVSVYGPDNNSSFLVILNYLSCTCCRAETLFSLGYWSMSPINPTYALPIYAMKKSFKSRFQGSSAANDDELGVLGRRQATACPNLRYLQRASKCKPASSARMSSDEIKQNNNQEAGCAPTQTFKAGKTITGHNKKAEIFLESLVHAASMNVFWEDSLWKSQKATSMQGCRFCNCINNLLVKLRPGCFFFSPNSKLLFLASETFTFGRTQFAIERIWSSFEKIRGSVSSMSPANYWQNLGQRLVDINIQKFKIYAGDRINQFYSHRDEFFQPTASPFKQEADEYKVLMLQRDYMIPGQTIYSIRSTVRQVEIRIRLLRSNEGCAGTKGLTKLLRNKTAEMKKLDNELTQEERMHHECNKLSRSAVLQEDDTKTGLGRYVDACLSEFVHSSEVIRKYMDVKDELKCIEEEFKLLDQDKEHFQAYLNREANSLV
eukprot:g38679.t1